jgi:hypothetical protein
MDAKSRHRQALALVLVLILALSFVAVTVILGLQVHDLKQQLWDCRQQIDASRCECAAYYVAPTHGMSGDPTLITDHEEAAFIHQFFLYTEYREVSDIITAMSILETGWYRSGMHREKNNYFSTKKKTCFADNENCYTVHRDIDASCRFVLNGVFRKRGYRTDREGFLLDIIQHGYAEDPIYVKKVQGVLKRLEQGA